jgi:hypothetical protein
LRKKGFDIFDLMLSHWASFLAYLNLFGIKGFIVVVEDKRRGIS